MGIPTFDVGDRVRLGNESGNNADGTARAPFKDFSGVATDPTTVTLKIRKPSGTIVTYNWPSQGSGTGVLIREATGRFYWDLSMDEAGDWAWQLSGTGAVETSEAGTLHVRRSPFG